MKVLSLLLLLEGSFASFRELLVSIMRRYATSGIVLNIIHMQSLPPFAYTRNR